MRERWKRESGWRRRSQPRPQSFRLLSTGRTDDSRPQMVGWCGTMTVGEVLSRERPRRAASAKMVPPRPPTPDSSLEDLTLNPSGLDLSLPDCKIIANRSARYPQRTPAETDDQGLKRFMPGEASKEFCKVSKDIKHERESYRDLTGKYSELPKDNKEKYSDMSAKESGLRISGKESKDKPKEKTPEGHKEIKAKVKKSDSTKTELKVNVSVGCKVIIVDPDGVYNCINLGRRIDVQWPSEQQRERGGKNYWGNWVPLEGMDGQVVHKWTPNHRDPKLRSHVDKTILLVQIDDKFVPIAENCVQDLGDEV